MRSSHLDVFGHLVDTLLPAIPGEGPAFTTAGKDLGLAARLPDIYARLPSDRHRRDLSLFLALLGSPVGGMALYGKPVPFPRLSPTDREAAFRRMETHPAGLIRQGAKALKALVALLWVTTDDPDHRPPAWDAMGYPGPDGPPPEVPKTLSTEQVSRDSTVECDVVVVGSGAGGGTAAGVLASAGLDVVVLEAGGYHNEADFQHLEAQAYRDMYLDGALNTTADGGMVVLAGHTLGGGTVINYTTSFPTPPGIREEWDRVCRFDGVFSGDEYSRSGRAVEERLSVNREHGWPSNRDQLLAKGLRELGWHVDEMPRNAAGCTTEACGYCTMGCRLGAKRSTLVTYLQDAAAAGARIFPRTRADNVLVSEGRAVGVVATSGEATLTVRARAVVLAAGALHTPAILLRSGVGGPAVGRFLRLHPVTAVWPRFPERVDPWTGILQTRYSDQFADLDGQGYGFKFETAPIHPLFPAAFIGWWDGASYKRDVLSLGHMGVVGILLRDKGWGSVGLRRDGSPVWRYRISRYDRRHVREGIRRAAEVAAAAGAEEVIASTMVPVRWRPSAEPLEAFMERVDSVGYGSNRTVYFTFHQMGTARMGSDPALSVVDQDNQTHDVEGLYVMDGSCFPTASGVNPMLTIATIAHRAATRLASRLG